MKKLIETVFAEFCLHAFALPAFAASESPWKIVFVLRLVRDSTCGEAFRINIAVVKRGQCAKWIFYPRVLCPFCWSTSLAWCPASGTGSVRSFTTVHKPGHPGWLPAVPYTVAVVTLTEGPTMLTTLIGVDPTAVRVGLPVEVEFVVVGEFSLPFFRPRGAAWTQADQT